MESSDFVRCETVVNAIGHTLMSHECIRLGVDAAVWGDILIVIRRPIARSVGVELRNILVNHLDEQFPDA